jgi:hypothetical protein
MLSQSICIRIFHCLICIQNRLHFFLFLSLLVAFGWCLPFSDATFVCFAPVDSTNCLYQFFEKKTHSVVTSKYISVRMLRFSPSAACILHPNSTKQLNKTIRSSTFLSTMVQTFYSLVSYILSYLNL